MQLIHAAQSPIGRVLVGLLGGLLLVEGAALVSLTGLVMMMVGVVLAVAGAAGIGVGAHLTRPPD